MSDMLACSASVEKSDRQGFSWTCERDHSEGGEAVSHRKGTAGGIIYSSFPIAAFLR